MPLSIMGPLNCVPMMPASIDPSVGGTPDRCRNSIPGQSWLTCLFEVSISSQIEGEIIAVYMFKFGLKRIGRTPLG